MAMTKKTINTYNFVLTSEQVAPVDAKIATLTADGSTDGYVDRIGNPGQTVIVTRHWLDEDAAGAWNIWCANYVAQLGYSYVSQTIENI
jgi:hypothetical protein